MLANASWIPTYISGVRLNHRLATPLSMKAFLSLFEGNMFLMKAGWLCTKRSITRSAT